jgi:hypothetical protein
MAKRQSRSNFKTLEEIINSEKEFSNLNETLKNYDIVETFVKIFPELALIAQAVKVEKNVLFLRVENSVWKSELNFRKTLIVEKINRYFNNQTIKTIKFL